MPLIQIIPAELPLIFGTHYEFRGNSTELEWLTSYVMEGNIKLLGLRVDYH